MKKKLNDEKTYMKGQEVVFSFLRKMKSKTLTEQDKQAWKEIDPSFSYYEKYNFDINLIPTYKSEN